MKKKFGLIILAGLGVLTSCGLGTSINYKDAKSRYEGILKSGVDMGDEFTVTFTSSDGSSTKIVVSKSSQVTYQLTKTKDSSLETWTGLKDGNYYSFTNNNGEKTYKESTTLTGIAWETSLASAKAVAATTLAIPTAFMATTFAHSEDDNLENYHFYSKGEGSVAVIYEKDGTKDTVVYSKNYFESYVEEKKQDDGKTKDVLSYKASAKVSLPSTRGYTKK